jgi:hypothetical protein
MIAVECTFGPVGLSLQSDAQLHPEIAETLMRQVTIHAAIAYSNLLKQGRECEVADPGSGE